MESKYLHKTEWHNHDAPNEIVPIIMELIKPKTVVDVGCGIGTFTSTFKKHGARVLGIDGPWADKKLLFNNLSTDEFVEMDLEKRISVPSKFDLVVCLEVAEHLSKERASTFIEDLVKLGDVILFSAAVPGQGGENHLNEQWQDYWQSHFENNSFNLLDIMRPLVWENEKIFWWYRQNMVLYINNQHDLISTKEVKYNYLSDPIHPEVLTTWNNYKDKNAIKRHLKILLKAIRFKITGS